MPLEIGKQVASLADFPKPQLITTDCHWNQLLLVQCPVVFLPGPVQALVLISSQHFDTLL